MRRAAWQGTQALRDVSGSFPLSWPPPLPCCAGQLRPGSRDGTLHAPTRDSDPGSWPEKGHPSGPGASLTLLPKGLGAPAVAPPLAPPCSYPSAPRGRTLTAHSPGDEPGFRVAAGNEEAFDDLYLLGCGLKRLGTVVRAWGQREGTPPPCHPSRLGS